MHLRLCPALLLSLAVLGACDDGEDRQAELAEFREEIGKQGLARVVIARMYQRDRWVVEAVDKNAPNSEKIQYVCDAIKKLRPTYVSGLVRLDADGEVSDEMIAVFKGVKGCIRDWNENHGGGKVRFDVVLNAKQYTSEAEKDGAIGSRGEGLDRLKKRLGEGKDATAADKKFKELSADGVFFDFFSVPWILNDDGDYHPDALADGIDFLHEKGYFVGGNTLGGHVPPGADYISLTDRGDRENIRDTYDMLAGKPKVPVLLHIRNDPHCVVSEGREYVEGTPQHRLRRLRRHFRWEREFGFTYMYPVLFPLYAPNDNLDGCDKKHDVEVDPGSEHEGFAFDASTEPELLKRMIKHLGDPSEDGKVTQKVISDEDAVPSPYDLEDEGPVHIHRADEVALGYPLYAASVNAIVEGPGFAPAGGERYFSLARSQGPGTLALHRCDLGAGRHLLTTDAGCEGAGVDAGSPGFIGATPIEGTVPLHRLSRAPNDHLYTTSALERDAALTAGWTYEGVAGHVWDERGLAVGEPPPAPPPVPPDPAAPCASSTIPVYRGWHAKRGQHLFATNRAELAVPGMTDEGVAFQLKPSPAPAGWLPFFRCLLTNSWHLLTTHPECEDVAGAIKEGALGNLATSAQPGTAQLYRYFHPAADGKNDHLFVIGDACVEKPGYKCEGAVGWVCPP